MNESRIEKKFLIEPSSKKKYIQIIKSLPFMIKRKYNSRQVNNIYLDTQVNQSLVDHLDGINKRYKCRIRWYGNFYDFNSPVLEFKMKISIQIYIPSSYPYFRTFWSLKNIKTNLKNKKHTFEKYFKNLILIHNNSYFKNWTNTITFEKDIHYFILKIKHSYFIK